MMSVEIMKLGPVHTRFDLLLPLVTQSWRVIKDEFSWGNGRPDFCAGLEVSG